MKLEMLILAAKSCAVYFKGKWIMSRIGKNEVAVPEGVNFSIEGEFYLLKES